MNFKLQNIHYFSPCPRLLKSPAGSSIYHKNLSKSQRDTISSVKSNFKILFDLLLIGTECVFSFLNCCPERDRQVKTLSEFDKIRGTEHIAGVLMEICVCKWYTSVTKLFLLLKMRKKIWPSARVNKTVLNALNTVQLRTRPIMTLVSLFVFCFCFSKFNF